MKNDTCIVCSTKFEPRENKLYCSDSCKTKAYNERQEKKEINMEVATEHEQTNKKPPIIYKFDMFEYNEILKDFNKLSFEMFCFIRKNLSGVPKIEEIKEYFKIMYKNKLDNLDDSYYEMKNLENLSGYNFKTEFKEFDKFIELFHSGQVEIFNSKKIDNLKEEVNT